MVIKEEIFDIFINKKYNKLMREKIDELFDLEKCENPLRVHL